MSAVASAALPALNPQQVNTINAVNQSVLMYQRMRAAADARRRTALEVAKELRDWAVQLNQPNGRPLYPTRLLALAEKLEA